MDHGLRRARFAERYGELGPGGVAISSRPNVRYLTGFTGSNAALLATPAEFILFTDGRYTEQAAREAAGLEVVTTPRLLRAVAERARSAGLKRLGFEGTLPYRDFGRLTDGAEGQLELISVSGAVEGLRLAKDADELGAIERAQALTDVGFDAIVDALDEGVSERDAALELEVAMRRAGADAVAFDPIVAFGEHAAEPHHAPCGRRLSRGDVVKLDFGALVDGYHADMTRTISFGELPGELREAYDLVRRAQAAGVDAVRAGARTGAVDRAARSVIEEAGLGERYTHPTGHGVGLEIHEAPWLRPGDDRVLPEGAVVTVEPGVYVPGLGGVRIEDMVLVTGDGRRALPRATKELVVL